MYWTANSSTRIVDPAADHSMVSKSTGAKTPNARHKRGATMNFRILAFVAALALTALTHADALFAQNYPAKPVRTIVPFAAGGPTDVAARLIAQKLSERLGRQFYIENIV